MNMNLENEKNTKGNEGNMNMEAVLKEDNVDVAVYSSDVITDIINEFGGRNDRIAWWTSIPKRDRFKTGDILYLVDTDRFGIFIQPSKKEGLVRTRLFKLGSKNETYNRDWYVDFEKLTLVKRGSSIKREFIETEKEYVKRAGKQIRRELKN